MTLLVDLPFDDTFDFTRGRLADYHDEAGEVVTAAVDVARIDHLAGAPRGLLVEGRPETDFADRCLAKTGSWDDGFSHSTVLHEYETPAGEIRRQAWYAGHGGPRGVVNACLAAKGWHRRIAVVPVFLPNRGGEVRWRDLFWALAGVIEVEPGTALAVQGAAMLLEG